MIPPGERLRRALELERLRGFPDTAVIGGLDRMLRALLAEGALAPGTPEHEALATLPARGYAALSPEQRARWAERVLRRLAEPRASAAGTAQRQPPPAPTAPVPTTAPRTARAANPSPRPALTARRSAPGRALATPHAAGLDAPVTALPGVSAATARKLARLEITTVRDLLWHLPHRYDDFSRIRTVSELVPGEEQTVVGVVWRATGVTLGKGRKATEAIVGDHTGNLRVVWFNQPWLAQELRTGARVALSGKVTVFHGVRQMESPEWELLEGDLSEAVHTGRLVPVYPLTTGLPARTLRRFVRLALDVYLPLVTDPLPAAIRARHGLPPLQEALAQVHYPDDARQAVAARRRLAFDELLVLQLAVLRRRAERLAAADAPPLSLPDRALGGFRAALPFRLTAAQERVIADILADLRRTVPMSRLVQGDVGSGKTVVAAVAALAAVTSGYQVALMAPTEILAEQHFRTFCRLFGGTVGEDAVCTCTPPFLERPLRIALLRGGLSPRERARAQEAINRGEVDVAVGTHALIQSDVRLPRLGLAIVDEQHRFGVAQRAALRGPRGNVHLLVMTATPIPRTLALTLYGDLDVSVIDELPPGRRPVKTVVVGAHERDSAYRFITEQLRQGRQAFIICPLVEESETLEVRAATAEYERLKGVFTSASLALLHGRMPAAQKDEVMRAFRDGSYDVLVSTAVVEVGIDVPNATVIMVEGAERFGLAQLHQFRGRVGRGEHQSYCFLMAEGASDEARERLHLLEEIADGFRLAEEDLRLRGPGEYFGTRQSGLPELRIASLADTRLLEQARAEAARWLADGTCLEETPLAGYAPDVARLLRGAGGDVS
jgi:ATP-dependent DNA helicase RecG